MVGVSILERKRLDLGHGLEVQHDRKGFAYLDIREQPKNNMRCCHSIGILNIEFQAISRSFGLGVNSCT